MQLTEDPRPIGDYFTDPCFARKKSDYRSGSLKEIRGYIRYEPLHNGQFRQLRCRHSLPV